MNLYVYRGLYNAKFYNLIAEGKLILIHFGTYL